MYEDAHLEADYEDRMDDSDEQYDPYGYDYSDDLDDYDDSEDQDDLDDEYNEDDSDEPIGIATFTSNEGDPLESDYYRRALQTAQFGNLI